MLRIALAMPGPVVKDAGDENGQGLVGLLFNLQLMVVASGELNGLEGEDLPTPLKDPVATGQG